MKRVGVLLSVGVFFDSTTRGVKAGHFPILEIVALMIMSLKYLEKSTFKHCIWKNMFHYFGDDVSLHSNFTVLGAVHSGNCDLICLEFTESQKTVLVN